MARIATLVVLFLALGSSNASAQGPTIPSKFRGEITYTSRTVDPATGLVTVTGDAITIGSLVGFVTGVESYVLDPTTGSFVGSGTRSAPDGSTYTVTYTGQLINATDSVGTWTVQNGTGRFAGLTGSGTFSASVWANQLGSSSQGKGTATRS